MLKSGGLFRSLLPSCSDIVKIHVKNSETTVCSVVTCSARWGPVTKNFSHTSQLVKKTKGVKLFVPWLPKSLAKLLLKTLMSNITHKVQYHANHELLESTLNAEPVLKKVIQHFSSHNLFMLLVI